MTAWTIVKGFVLRPLGRRPLRAAPAAVGMALGVAVILAIRLANVAVLEAFVAATDSLGGQTDLRIYGASGPFAERQLNDLRWLEQFGTISPVLEAYAMLVSPEVEQLAERRQPLARGEVLLVLGVDVLQDQQIRRYEVWQWHDTYRDRPERLRMLELLIEPDSIVLTERFARKHGIRIGDPVRLAFGSRVEAFRVRGLLRDTGPARTWQGNFALMDLSVVQSVTGRLGFLDAIDIRLHAARDFTEVFEAIRSRLPSGLVLEPPASRLGRTQTMVAAFQFNLTALSLVALVVGLFLVATTVSYSVTSRRQEIAVLLALGTPRTAVARMFVVEAALVAAVGICLGIPLGHFLARGAVKATSQTVETFYVAAVAEAAAKPLVLFGWESLRCSVLALLVAIVAAAGPAWQAASLDPLVVLRDVYLPVSSGTRLPWRLAILGLVLGAFAVQIPPVDGLPLGGYVAALSWAMAIAALTPMALVVLAALTRRYVRNPRWLALRLAIFQLSGSRSTLSTSVAALAMALGMMFAIAIMVGSFRTTVVYWLDSVLTSDLVIKPIMSSATLWSATLDSEVVQCARQRPEVEAVAWYSSRQIPYGRSTIRLDTSDLKVLLDRGRIRFKEPADAVPKLRSWIQTNKPLVLISESFSLRYEKYPGDHVSLDTPRGRVELPVGAVYYDYSSNLGTILIDFDLYQRLFDDEHPQRAPMALSLYVRPGTDVEKLRATMIELLKDRHLLYFVTNKDLREEALKIFDSTFAITYALLVIALFVAIVGIVAALFRLVRLRRHEIALLACLGLTPYGVRLIVFFKSLIVTLLSYILGWCIGLVLAWVLIYVINVQSFGWTIQFHLPWDFLWQSLVMVLATALVCGWWPAQAAAMMDPVVVLREE